MVLLDGCDIGEIDAGKCVVALGPLLLAAGSGDHFAVKDNVHPVGAVVGGEKQAVRQIGARVGIFHVDGLLGPGDHDGFGGVLNQVGQGRGGVGHGVRAVADHKAVVAVVVLLNGRFKACVAALARDGAAGS